MKQVWGIWLPKDDHHLEPILRMGPRLYGKATYQLNKYKAALKHVRRRGLAVDVGGHVGLWSRVMAYDFERVVTFEPVELHRQCFEKNCSDHPYYRIELNPCAVGAHRGFVDMHTPFDNTGHSQVVVEARDAKVPMVTLDSHDFGADSIDFLKIDVEGYEINVVHGAEARIRKDKPTIIIEQKKDNAENFGYNRYDALGLLKRWGMREALEISGDHIMVW